MEEVAKGAIEGAFNFTKEQIIEAAHKLQNRELAFIRDQENINAVKRERNSAEYKFIKEYLIDADGFHILIQMGLTLRSLRFQSPTRSKVTALCRAISERHGTAGLHIAELAEQGLVTDVLKRLLQMYNAVADVRTKLSQFLKQSEKLAIFIRADRNEKEIANKVKVRLETLDFPIVILVSLGSAMRTLKRIIELFMKSKAPYSIETEQKEGQLTAFFSNPEDRAEVDHWTDLATREEEL